MLNPKKFLWWAFEPSDEREEAILRRAYKFSFFFLLFFWLSLGNIFLELTEAKKEITGMQLDTLIIVSFTIATIVGYFTLRKEELPYTFQYMPKWGRGNFLLLVCGGLIIDFMPDIIRGLRIAFPILQSFSLLSMSTTVAIVASLSYIGWYIRWQKQQRKNNAFTL
ncbi:MAG: hypothetical protein HYV32_01810 [Candidatus Kerfeldbacteria bacterium]|nr:hypothetical protein [Candidatus Kerfeldbacteria bacterium]